TVYGTEAFEEGSDTANADAVLTTDLRLQIGKMIRLLGSNEAAAAASAIDRSLRGAGLDLHALARFIETASPNPDLRLSFALTRVVVQILDNILLLQWELEPHEAAMVHNVESRLHCGEIQQLVAEGDFENLLMIEAAVKARRREHRAGNEDY